MANGVWSNLASSLGVLWDNFIVTLPRTFAAVIIVVLGYLVASIIAKILRTSLNKARFEEWLSKKGMQNVFGGLELSTLIGSLVKWWLFILFLVPAVNVLNFGQISSLISNFAAWFPNLVLAIIIIFIGVVFADFLATRVLQAKNVKGIKGISAVVKVSLILIFADIALRQIGVAVVFAETVALIVLAGIMLAIAIGFGLGLRPYAEEMVTEMKRRFR
ncbi:hypothetical protein HYV49_04890 [Candidatus Pacearchaeota archaeon]|nr:hypothetical protein [Candidatus Pacearchaeota archaeon]